VPVATSAQVGSPPKLRRRPILICLAIALIAVGGLGAAWLTTAIGNTHSVIALGKNVPRGAVIKASDLTLASINIDPVLHVMPATARNQLIGKRAAIDLAAGSLVTPDSVTNQTIPQRGQSLVGVTLTSAQMPAIKLKTGDNIRFIATPRTQDAQPTGKTSAISATVVDTRTSSDSGPATVDVTVPSIDAAPLAALAATGRIALILDSGAN
jgi:hypothetical protein